MADAQVVLVPNPEAVAGGDWVVNADGVLEPAVPAPVCLPRGILQPLLAVSLGADVDDFDPGGAGSLAVEMVFLAATGNPPGGRVITGMVAPVLTAATAADKALRVRFFNFGGSPLVLPGLDGGSVAANQFETAFVMGATRGPVIVWPGNLVDLLYDRSSSKWVILAPIIREVGVSLQTTDATLSQLYDSGNLGEGQVLKIRADVTAARAGSLVGRAGYTREAVFFRDGAAATALEGAIQTGFTRESAAGLDCSFVLTGNAVSVTVTGLAAETFNWRGRITSDVAET